jgi:catechol-2,3-dioxygenase
MIQVKRLGHATLTTPDLDAQVDYFTEIVGLSLLERDRERAFLASKQGQEAMALERGNEARLSRLAFQVAPGSDLGELTQRLARDGIKSERRRGISAGVAEAIAFADPHGTQIDVYADYVFAKDDRKQAGVMPLKLGHVANRVADVQGIVNSTAMYWGSGSRTGAAIRLRFCAAAPTITPSTSSSTRCPSCITSPSR